MHRMIGPLNLLPCYKAAAAVSVWTYTAWESTATLHLHGGARGSRAPTGEERGGIESVTVL